LEVRGHSQASLCHILLRVTFEPVGHPRAQKQPVRGFVRGREDGHRIDLPGWTMLVKVSDRDTQGRLAVIEDRMTARLVGPPAHVHDGHDETLVVLEGRMRFRIGNPFHTAGGRLDRRRVGRR